MADATVTIGLDSSALQAGADRALATVKGFTTKASAALGKLSETDFLSFVNPYTAVAGVALGVLKGISDDLDRINDLAGQLNTSPESLQRLGMQAKLTGTDLETVVKALFKFNRALRDGSNPAVAEALQKLNVNAADYLRLAPEQQIAQLAEAYQRAEIGGLGYNEAVTLLGKSASELLPLLRASKEQMKEMAEVSVVSDETVERVAQFNDGLDIAIQKAKVLTVETVEVLLRGLQLSAKTAENLFKNEDLGFLRAFGKATDEAGKLKFEQDQAKQEVQRMRDAQAEAAARAREQAAELQKSAAIAKTLQTQLAAEKKKTEASVPKPEGETVDKLAAAREKVLRLQEQINLLLPESEAHEQELLQLQIQEQQALQERNALQAQYNAESQRQAEDEARKAEQLEKQRATQQESLAHYRAELAILQEQAAGHQRKAEAMDRSLRIADEAQRLMRETGVSEQDALRLAKERVAVEDKLRQQGNNGPERKRIQGFKQEQGRARDFAGLDNVTFQGLQGLDRLNRGGAAFPREAGPVSPDFTGLTRRAASVERARATATAQASKDSGPEIVRLLQKLESLWASALN